MANNTPDRITHRIIKAACTGLTLLTCLTGAHAQEDGEEELFELQAYEVRSDRDVGYYAGNSVSATKTAVPISDIPINIQVMTRDFIEDVGAVSIDDALFYVAGANPDTNEPGRYSIRGFTSPEPTRNGVSTLAEFYQGTTIIDRVEVVKGPASILYGISEPGGIINYITKQPLSENAASIRLMTGTYDKIRGEVDVTGPLYDGDVSMDYRVVASYENSDSWVDFAGIEETIIAPSAKWYFGEDTSLLATVEYYNVHRNIEGPRVRNNARDAYLDLPRDFNPGGQSYKDTETIFANTDFQHRFNENWIFRNVLNYSENDYIQDTRLGYAREGAGPAGDNEIRIHLLSRDVLREQFTSQTELTGEFEWDNMSLNVLVGHEYEEFEQRQIALRQNNVMIWDLADPSTWDTSFPVAPEDRSINPADFLRKDDQNAFYGMLQAGFFENSLRTLLGVRYDILNGDLNDFRSGNKTSNPEVTNTTPQLGALYKVTDKVSVYGLYSESFTPNLQVNPDGSTFDPATGKGKEFGFKFDLMENRVSATVSFYEIEKENIVRIDQEAQQLDPPVLRYVPSGTEESQGMDIDVVYTPTNNYQLVFSYAYIDDAKVVSNTDAPATEGMRLPSTPKNSISLWNKYTFTEGRFDGMFIGGGYTHRDAARLNVNRAFQVTPSYDRIDLLVGYSGTVRENPYRIELKVNNLTDEIYNLRQDIIAPGLNFQLTYQMQF